MPRYRNPLKYLPDHCKYFASENPFKKALKIYEDIWADEPELIEEKYQAIQELYPQAGIALAKSILLTKH